MSATEERQRKIANSLTSSIEQMFYNRAKETMEYFHKNREDVLQSFLEAFTSSVSQAQSQIDKKHKQQIKFVQFSFLLSGALMNEHHLKIDFYDSKYFGDIVEVGGYWDYSILFPYVYEDIEILRNVLIKQKLSVRDYDILDLRLSYHVGLFAIMEEILMNLVKEVSFAKTISGIFEPEVLIIYGAYLGQAKLIASIERR